MKKMKKYYFISILLSFSFGAFAQNTMGTIKYERKQYWINIMSQLPWITKADIDRNRLTWGKEQGWGRPYMLSFKNGKSVYEAVEEENETGYSWKQEEYKLIRDNSGNKSKDIVETLGKKFIIEGEIPKYKWKILNEIKEVAGYLCMKAETYDPIKDQTIQAWFTDAIPVDGGPEGLSGLPGMILAIDINNGCLTVIATEVSLDDNDVELAIPTKKIRGKKINREDFNTKLKGFIEDSMEGEKNPYWTIRY